MLIEAAKFQLYADIFEKLENLNEGEDVAAMYGNAEWVVKDLKSKGLNVKK